MKAPNTKHQTPNKKIALLSFGYWFGAHSVGLLIHPYQSVRRIVRDNFYKPLVWLPSVTLVIWWLLAFLVSRWNVLATLGLSFLAIRLEHWGPTQISLAFMFVWGVIFLLCWQLILSYLFFRFTRLKHPNLS